MAQDWARGGVGWLVGADSVLILVQGDDIDGLSQVLQQSEGKQIVLQVYSTKRQQLRGT